MGKDLELFRPLVKPGPKPPASTFECVEHVAPLHGLRVDVYSGLQQGWVLLTPTASRDTGGVAGALRVCKRYETMCRSLSMNSPRVQRYLLTATRLVVAPPGGAAYVVEAYGDPDALRSMADLAQARLLIEPVREDRPRRVYPARPKRPKGT